jgi:hypothetical protein
MKQGIIPKYANIKTPSTSPTAKNTQKKVQLTRMKEEIKYRYKKKDFLNEPLNKTHLQAAFELGR